MQNNNFQRKQNAKTKQTIINQYKKHFSYTHPSGIIIYESQLLTPLFTPHSLIESLFFHFTLIFYNSLLLMKKTALLFPIPHSRKYSAFLSYFFPLSLPMSMRFLLKLAHTITSIKYSKNLQQNEHTNQYPLPFLSQKRKIAFIS